MRRLFAHRIFLAGLLFGITACSTPRDPVLENPIPAPAPGADTFADRQMRLASYREEIGDDSHRLYLAATQVEISDGIQEREAWILAQAYLHAWIDKHASIIEMKQSPLEWIAENMSAATNGPGPTIRVNKVNGSIQRSDSLQLVWPESFRDKL